MNQTKWWWNTGKNGQSIGNACLQLHVTGCWDRFLLGHHSIGMGLPSSFSGTASRDIYNKGRPPYSTCGKRVFIWSVTSILPKSPGKSAWWKLKYRNISVFHPNESKWNVCQWCWRVLGWCISTPKCVGSQNHKVSPHTALSAEWGAAL